MVNTKKLWRKVVTGALSASIALSMCPISALAITTLEGSGASASKSSSGTVYKESDASVTTTTDSTSSTYADADDTNSNRSDDLAGTANGAASLSAASSAPEDTTTTPTTPVTQVKVGKVTISKLENLKKGVRITWKKTKNATGYKIYRSKNNGSYTLAKTIKSASTLTWDDTAAKTNGNKYKYKIRAYHKDSSGTVVYGSYSAYKAIFNVSQPTITSLKNSKKSTLAVKWSKNTKATGYQIQYSSSKSFSKHKTVTINKRSTVSKTIKKSIKKGKTYYVRVRTYRTVKGVKYYSKWSVIKKVKVKK